MHRPEIFVATPLYGDDIKLVTFHTLFGAAMDISQLGWQMELKFIQGSFPIHFVRNVFCDMFLRTKCTDLIFLDSDVGVEPHTFPRMVNSDVDIFIAPYRMKTPEPRYPVVSNNPDGSIVLENNGLARVKHGPAGCMRIKRHVIEKMAEGSPMCKNVDYHRDAIYPRIFDYTYDANGQFIGEDTEFCRKWREMGGSVWVDPYIKTDHAGHFVYSGRFIDVLKPREMSEAAE